MRFKVHVYSILMRKGWHYSGEFDDFNNLMLFLHCHKMQYFDERVKHRLYRVHDFLDNKDTFYIVDFEKCSYKHNHVKLVTKYVACDYISEVM